MKPVPGQAQGPARFGGAAAISVDPVGADWPDIAAGFLQSAFWGDFKERTGWKASRFLIGTALPPFPGGEGACPLLVLERKLRAGFSFAYVPHGPEKLPEGRGRDSFLEELASALKPMLSPRCLFIRFDLPQEAASSGTAGDAGRIAGIRKGSPVQPPDTVLLDLDPPEADLLAAMKPKWRYNIRLAEKKGVEVREEGAEALDAFYDLYLGTAARDRIAIHPRSYYEALFAAAAGAAKDGSAGTRLSVWVARYRGEPLAAIVTLFRGRQAVYLYGASSDRNRALMPAYALQWAAIRAAKARGCREYDFFGIPPDDDPAHPMAGLYRFKTGFGGRIVHREGCRDRPYKPAAYFAFRTAERARSFWFKRVVKAGLASTRGKAGGSGPVAKPAEGDN